MKKGISRKGAKPQRKPLRNLLALFAFCILTALLFCPEILLAQKNRTSNRNDHVDALVVAPTLVTYVDDGAADMSVVDAGTNRNGYIVDPIPAVKNMVELGPSAIPILIAHLDDTRPTSAKFFHYVGPTEKYESVPVGHVCLDILMNIVDAPKIITKECGDDGLGACIERGYYFRPDAYVKKGNSFLARPEVLRTKANWERANRRRWLRFRYPETWKRT